MGPYYCVGLLDCVSKFLSCAALEGLVTCIKDSQQLFGDLGLFGAEPLGLFYPQK